jgi:hypothetical protein
MAGRTRTDRYDDRKSVRQSMVLHVSATAQQEDGEKDVVVESMDYQSQV